MAFNLEGRIKIRDDGATIVLKKVEKATLSAKKATDSYASTNDALTKGTSKS